MPYTSSIILVETLEEILSDKIRALYERQYIKGRDIYDVWWLTKKLGISTQWPITQNKFEMYQAPFVAAREADFFQKKEHVSNITAAIESDLTRFIPQNIYSLHRERNFGEFINTLKEVTSGLLNQGMRSFLKTMKEQKATLKRLKLLPNLFRRQDAEKVAPHTAMFLSRAVQDGMIHRNNRGNYINSFLYGFPEVEDVPCFLKPPAYITCEWALNFHGISMQAPVVCTVVTLSTSVGKKQNVQYQGITIEFSKISNNLYFGFINHDNFYLATPEKAILDTLYYRRVIPVFDELDLDGVDYDALIKMAEKFPTTVSRAVHEIIGDVNG